MDGKVAMVTCGGTGIGAATVRLLVGRGVRCVINYAHSRDAAEALAERAGVPPRTLDNWLWNRGDSTPPTRPHRTRTTAY